MTKSIPRLTEGAVGSTLMKLTFPMLAGILSIVAFNLIDTYFVGKIGTTELAAMSFTFPVVFVVGSIAMGLGIGASSTLSKAIGEGDRHRVQRLTTDSLTLALIIVVAFVVTGMLTIEPLFRSLGASPEIIPLIKKYMMIWYPGMIFIVIPMVGNSAIRATGDTKTPGLLMVISAIINLILDPLLIFGPGPFPEWGLEGAAVATVFARFVSLLISIRILHFREKMITFEIPSLNDGISSWKKILYIGLPAAATNMIIPVSMGIITRFVSGYGPEAVAALGVSLRIESVSLAVIMALGSVVTPFVGQNWGGKKIKRLKLAVKYSQKFGMIWGIILAALFFLLGGIAGGFFSDNPIVVKTIRSYLTIVSLSYGFQAVLMLSSSVLNALNRPIPASILSVLRMAVLYIPLAYIGSLLFAVPGIFWAAAISNIIAGVISYFWLRNILIKL